MIDDDDIREDYDRDHSDVRYFPWKVAISMLVPDNYDRDERYVYYLEAWCKLVDRVPLWRPGMLRDVRRDA